MFQTFLAKTILYRQMHRVVALKDENKMKTARRSLTYFLSANNDVKLSDPLDYEDEELNEIEKTKADQMKSLTSKQYMEERLYPYWEKK